MTFKTTLFRLMGIKDVEFSVDHMEAFHEQEDDDLECLQRFDGEQDYWFKDQEVEVDCGFCTAQPFDYEETGHAPDPVLLGIRVCRNVEEGDLK